MKIGFRRTPRLRPGFIVCALVCTIGTAKAAGWLDWQAMPVAPTSVVNQAVESVAVTKADANLPRIPTRGLYIGDASACNLSLELMGDTSAVAFNSVQPGSTLPLIVKQVRSATTCASVVALY